MMADTPPTTPMASDISPEEQAAFDLVAQVQARRIEQKKQKVDALTAAVQALADEPGFTKCYDLAAAVLDVDPLVTPVSYMMTMMNQIKKMVPQADA